MACGPSIVKVLMLQRTKIIYELCTVLKREYSGIPISPTLKANENWFGKSGRSINSGIEWGGGNDFWFKLWKGPKIEGSIKRDSIPVWGSLRVEKNVVREYKN